MEIGKVYADYGKGESKTIETSICGTCWGTGWETQFIKPCKTCKGEGDDLPNFKCGRDKCKF